MKMKILKIILILFFPFICCKYFDYSSNAIINFNFILSSSIDILAVALAITAIFFTVIDRYKDKQDTPKSIDFLCFPILKEMCENVFGILFSVALMFFVSIFESLFDAFVFPEFMGKFSVSTYIYLTGFIFILAILFDITKSVLNLTCGLFIKPNQDLSNDDKYMYLVEISKELDSKRFDELLEDIKSLIIKQHLEKNRKK